MKIELKTVNSGSAVNVYGCDNQDTPSWFVLKYTQDTHTLQGYVGLPGVGGLAVIKPVKMTHQRMTPETVQAYAQLVFTKVTGLEPVVEGTIRANKASIDEIASGWDAFLENKDTAEAVKEDTSGFVEFNRDDFDELRTSGQIAKLKSKGFAIPVNTSVQVGVSDSGFTAIKVQAGVAKIFAAVQPATGLDMAAAQEALKAVDRPSSHAVHWYGSAQGEAKTFRTQASSSYPVLAGVIADNLVVRQAVDTRQSLQEVMTEITGLTKPGLKRLSKVTTAFPSGRLFSEDEAMRGEDALGVNRDRRFSTSGHISIEAATRALAELPVDRVPSDDANWMAFFNILSGCAIPLANATNVSVGDVLKPCNGDWIAFQKVLAKAANFDADKFGRREIALTTMDALEAMDDFCRSAVIPQALTSIADTEQEIPTVSGDFFYKGDEAAQDLTIGNSNKIAVSLFEMARRYASRIPSLMDILAIDQEAKAQGRAEARASILERYGDEEFPVLLDEYRASNGIVLKAHGNFRSMRGDSNVLGHCVGRMYTGKAKNIGNHMFSVQDAEGKILSTLELSGAKGDDLPTIRADLRNIQHRGYHNGVPSESEKFAAKEFVAGIKSGRIDIDIVDVVPYRDARKTHADNARTRVITWESALENDWCDTETRGRSWQEWRFIIGGAVGKSDSPEVIYRSKHARDLVSSMNPQAAMIMMRQAEEKRNAAKLDVEADAPTP